MFDLVLKEQSHQNIDDLIVGFLKSLDVRESSKQTYKRQLGEFLVWAKLKELLGPSREDIIAYKDYLQNTKELSAFTVSGYLTAVKKFFEWLESMKIYPNIAKGVKGPKKRRGFRKDCLTLEQVKKLLKAIDRKTIGGKRDYAMLNLMIRTGLRTIEVARANREDICRQSGETIMFIHGKGRDGKDEMVVLTPQTLEPIQDYLAERKHLKKGTPGTRDPIFASHSTKNKGKRLTTKSVSRIVKTRLRDIDLDDPRLTAHSLRHTAVTFSLLGGATPQEAKSMARHSDINTTLIYAHNINRIKQAPEKKIDSFLNED